MHIIHICRPMYIPTSFKTPVYPPYPPLPDQSPPFTPYGNN